MRGTKGSIGTGCAALLPDITTDQTCARQERDLRAFAKKAGYKIVGVWNEIAPGPKQERAERTQEPEFASPEQFAGVPVDIRSDL